MRAELVPSPHHRRQRRSRFRCDGSTRLPALSPQGAPLPKPCSPRQGGVPRPQMMLSTLSYYFVAFVISTSRRLSPL